MTDWHYPRSALSHFIVSGVRRNLIDRLTLVAPRMQGKTHFLKHDLLPNCTDMLAIYVDFDFDLESACPEKIFIESVFSALGIESKPHCAVSVLKVYDHLNSLNTPIILLVDEIANLASSRFDTFTASLRSFMCNRGDDLVKGVFTSSSDHDLDRLFYDYDAPFYRSSRIFDFPPLDKEFVQHQLNAFSSATGGYEIDIGHASEYFKQIDRRPDLFIKTLKMMVERQIYELGTGIEVFAWEQR